MTKEQSDAWIKDYDKWKSENEHLPNLQPGKQIIDRMLQNPSPNNNPATDPKLQALGVRLDTMEDKLKWISKIIEKLDNQNPTDKVDSEANRKLEEIPYQFRDHALFVAFAPYKNPRYAISVVVEHGGSGSSSAAPIAKKIIKKVLDRHLLRRSKKIKNSESI